METEKETESEFHYPIMYAPFKIEKMVGWDSEGFQIYEECAWLSAPCYITGKNTEYYSNGSESTVYKGVFPYPQLSQSLLNYGGNMQSAMAQISPTVPRHDVWGTCNNCEVVEAASDDFETMKQLCHEKNRKLIANTLLCMASEERDTKRQAYWDMIADHYQLLEYFLACHPTLKDTIETTIFSQKERKKSFELIKNK